MATIKSIIDDVILQLTQSDPSDDLALDRRQLIAWLSYHYNLLVANEINSKLALQEMVPQIYVTRQACIIADAEENDCGPECENRISVTLTYPVMTLNDDGGIIMVQTEDGSQILKAGDIRNVILFRQMRFSKPTEDTYLYYRQDNKIYIEGMRDSSISLDEIHVWYVRKRDFTTEVETTEVVISDLVLPLLIDQLVQRGKLELVGGIQSDIANDGVHQISPVYHRQITDSSNE